MSSTLFRCTIVSYGVGDVVTASDDDGDDPSGDDQSVRVRVKKGEGWVGGGPR